ncbi:MAG: ribosome maturation factor RimP [Deltaproteobacteria bacterium]|nr:ribosome maturation factor RimP [Deltaproteobacteria bacterium]
MDDLGRIRKLADAVCRDAGIDLFDVEVLGGGKRRIVRVTIDCPTGVTVEDCAKVSRELSTHLDVEDVIAGAYHLEVSSPGLDRPIRHDADARAAVGKMVKVKTKRDVDGRKSFKGRLKEVKNASWVVEVDGREFEIARELVDKAHQVYEF